MNLNSNNFLISKLNLNRTRKDKLVHSFTPKKPLLTFFISFFFLCVEPLVSIRKQKFIPLQLFPASG